MEKGDTKEVLASYLMAEMGIAEEDRCVPEVKQQWHMGGNNKSSGGSYIGTPEVGVSVNTDRFLNCDVNGDGQSAVQPLLWQLV